MTKIKIGNNIGTLIKKQGTYGLFKFEFGQFVFNLNSLNIYDE